MTTNGHTELHYQVVNVADTETIEKSKKIVVYKVAIACEGKTWFILRKYNEFLPLYDKLKKQHPRAQLKLPGKKFFGNLDPDLVRTRREGLYDFVHKILINPIIRQVPDVREFLNLDRAFTATDSELEDSSNPDGDDNPMNLGPSESRNSKPGDFEFLRVIGKGSFGKVLLAKHKTEGKLYAVKVLNKDHILRKNEAEHIMSERNVLVKNVKHPFLVGVHYSFQTSDKLYFVLDYVNGGEVFFHLQRERVFSEQRTRFYAAEMASALGYLHSLDIIYRDLKPENILLDSQGHLVLTDFGLCKEGLSATDTTSTFCGTPEYLAPEVLRKAPYDKTVDWWCLGAVTYEMLFGLPPFYSRDTSEMYENILHQPLKFRTNVASAAAKSLLEGLLTKNKEGRLGYRNDIEEVKSHAFFAAINWTQLLEKKMKPPYNPNVSGQMDLRHFDPEFVREPVPASVGRGGGIMAPHVQEAANNAFQGFSYVNTEGALNQ